MNRVDGGTGGYAREDYVHDKNGNLTTVARRVNVTDTSPAQSDSYAIASGTNRLTSVAHAAGTRSFTHDARGNLTTDTRPAGAGVTLAYDGHARLASYARAGAETQAMLYNGFDERVGLTTMLGGSAVEERRFAYDAGHRIVGEYGATSADLRAEYIWLLPEVGDGSAFGGDDGLGGYMPLAVAVPDGVSSKLHWVQGNHLGTPAVMTDASGTPVTPSGYARIGFPGQVEQHADLYYNYYRDYDPTLGRYVQADPIGLEGDVNPYLYAGGNPLRKLDPNGLVELVYNRTSGYLYAYEDGRRFDYLLKMLASSGRPDCGCKEDAKDNGPIPVGAYEIKSSEVSGNFLVNAYRYLKHWQDWGSWRVSLHPSRRTSTYGRSGFFLHGGLSPGSAGCIDVGGGVSGNMFTRKLRDLIENDPDGLVPLRVVGPVGVTKPIQWGYP